MECTGELDGVNIGKYYVFFFYIITLSKDIRALEEYTYGTTNSTNYYNL